MITPKLIDVTPFEPLIIKTHYDGFDWKKLEYICEKLIETSYAKVHLETGNAGSSASNYKMQPHIMPEFKDFYKFIDPIAKHILHNEWDLYKQHDYFISNSWVNFHGEGGVTEKHHHGATILTMAAYLQLPKDGGFIQFRDPLEYVKGFTMREYDDEMFGWKTIEAQTGDIIMFPGYIRHRTQPNKNSKEKRWVLTTNYMSSYGPPLPQYQNKK